MKHFVLFTMITMPVLWGIEINHGDAENTKTHISTSDEGDLHVSVFGDLVDSQNYIINENTGVRVSYSVPVSPDNEGNYYYLNLNKNGKDYKYDFSNGYKQTREEEGTHVKDKDGSESLEVKGSYSYLDSKDHHYIQSYEADKNGFRTKIAFGPKIKINYEASAIKSPSPPSLPGKNIDGTLLCSLIGGGCKK